MSHIGKKPIKVPLNVTNLAVQSLIGTDKFLICNLTSSPQELHSLKLSPLLDYKMSSNGSHLVVLPPYSNKKFKDKSVNEVFCQFSSILGGEASKIRRFFEVRQYGVRTQLGLVGMGYRISLNQQTLSLKRGRSHSVEVTLPENIKAFSTHYSQLTLYGSNEAERSKIVREIRQYRLPEPYKGKGLKYRGEKLHMKTSKKSA